MKIDISELIAAVQGNDEESLAEQAERVSSRLPGRREVHRSPY